MEKTAKILSAALCTVISVTAAMILSLNALLPTQISVEENTISTEAFSAAALRKTSDGYSYYLGAIPIKCASAQTVVRPQLIPCGTPFGIRLKSEGVMVVSVGDNSPAKKCGIKEGDIITEVNNVRVTCNADVSRAVQLQPESTEIIIQRGNRTICLFAVPQQENGIYKIGTWVRDSAAGIGTLTFFDPESGRFGGLGHAVSDVTTGEPVPLASGEITRADIYDVVRGECGSAGELCGALLSDCPVGTLSSNTEIGVFGTLDEMPSEQPLPMAFRQEVQCGEAVLLSTVSGRAPQRYTIEIEKINLCDTSGSKSMVIRITDPRLLAKTGGIVRGMSGSPIIQNGKIVGAVTHVLVNDPEKGYAIFAETMWEEMNRQQ